MDGILPVYKPAGITSYDVIRVVKRLLPKGHKIGHAGTLDPFAQGILILLLGKATKKFDEIRGWQKTYLAVARLGCKSDTLDIEGSIEQEIPKIEKKLTREEVQREANKFVGETLQAVPLFSAAKYKGQPLYKYARRGEKTPSKSKMVRIYSIEILEAVSKRIEMRVVCASGTYIRQLSYDILKGLELESCLEKLVRTAVGEITLTDVVHMDELENLETISSKLK